MSDIVRVLIVDDHPPFRMGLSVLLEQHDDIEVVESASTGAEALKSIGSLQPHIVLLDCQLPDIDGPSVAKQIMQMETAVKIIALSAFDESNYIREMLDSGAVGYLLKSESPETIAAALRAVATGATYFSASIVDQVFRGALEREQESTRPTAREAEVLDCLSNGMTNGQIARHLDISERTVSYHIVNLQNKLDADNRTQIVVEAIRRKWISIS